MISLFSLHISLFCAVKDHMTQSRLHGLPTQQCASPAPEVNVLSCSSLQFPVYSGHCAVFAYTCNFWLPLSSRGQQRFPEASHFLLMLKCRLTLCTPALYFEFYNLYYNLGTSCIILCVVVKVKLLIVTEKQVIWISLRDLTTQQ
jgi:hypothetical protein